MKFVRIGNIKDEQTEANLVELEKVIHSLEKRIEALEAEIKKLGGNI